MQRPLPEFRVKVEHAVAKFVCCDHSAGIVVQCIHVPLHILGIA